MYREWLRRQYAAFHARLLALIEEGAPQEVQVAAVAALLEGVRGREGSGRCDNSLLGAAVAALVTSRAAAPDAISYLISTFLPCADVRWEPLLLRLFASRCSIVAGVRGGSLGPKICMLPGSTRCDPWPRQPTRTRVRQLAAPLLQRIAMMLEKNAGRPGCMPARQLQRWRVAAYPWTT